MKFPLCEKYECIKKVWRVYAYDTFSEHLLIDEVCDTKLQAQQALVDIEDAGFFWNDDEKLEREDDESTIEWSIEEEEILDWNKVELALSKAEKDGAKKMLEKYEHYIRNHDLSLWCERERFKEWRMKHKREVDKDG